jgi:uncharacterized membrane protein
LVDGADVLQTHAMTKLERRARIANGLLVLFSSLLMLVPSFAEISFWLTLFMGLSLIFSGVTGFCGWVRILGLWK